MFPGVTVRLEEGAHVGHGAIIHGAHLGRNVMIGMNSVIMDEVVIGAGSIVGALSFVKAKTIVPERSLVVGNPGKIIRQVSDEMLAWKTKGTQLYQQLPTELHDQLEACEPLRAIPADRPPQESLYATWEEIKES
jgi:carbonic anhydrase/acetyltransferase-like protein (isoleucine patch superfamily)